jgi:hypothetical protein
MDDLTRKCLDRLTLYAECAADSAPERDWGKRMHDAVDSLRQDAEIGRISGESLMHFATYTAHLWDAINPPRTLTRKGILGGNARHDGHRALRDFAIDLFRQGRWPSKRRAAKAIFPKMQAYASNKHLPLLCDTGGEMTVYRWILQEDVHLQRVE